VETPAQLTFLRRLGCDAAQGFLLGYPTEAVRIMPLLAA
jgi:EAL domain-containing protein (putative c-di-GMP-specific phosphodiesterase class I)